MISTLRPYRSGWFPVSAATSATPPTRGEDGRRTGWSVGRGAPRGGVQAGGDGGGGDRPVGPARRPTGCRFRQAAKAQAGPGALRGGGSGGRRGREGAPAGRSGTAPHGAKVQAGGEGGKGTGWSVRRGAPQSEGSSGRRGREGAGRRVHRPGPRPPGWPYPLCPICGRDRARAGAPCAPWEHPDYIYQRVVTPEAPTALSSVTRSGQGGPSRQSKSDISPPRCPFPGSGPLPSGLPGGSNPRTPARTRRSGPGCAPGNHRGALAVRRAPHPTFTVRVRPGQGGEVVSRTAGPGARATRERRTHRPGSPRLTPTAPPALPHPTDQPARPPALAASLTPRPGGPDTRATASAPALPPPSPPA